MRGFAPEDGTVHAERGLLFERADESLARCAQSIVVSLCTVLVRRCDWGGGDKGEDIPISQTMLSMTRSALPSGLRYVAAFNARTHNWKHWGNLTLWL